MSLPMMELIFIIKKESPNEGTETRYAFSLLYHGVAIKKESPNEGTETTSVYRVPKTQYKKRIPE